MFLRGFNFRGAVLAGLMVFGGVRGVSLVGQGMPASAPLPEFEVATIKPATAAERMVGLFTYPGGRVEAVNYPLNYLVYSAFGVEEFQVSGGPDWIDSVRYDVEAKPAADSAAAKTMPTSMKSALTEEQRLMLQALLRDRFQLKVHWVTKEGPGYLLVQSGKPLKLTSPKDPNALSWAGSVNGASGMPFAHGIEGTNISMKELAQRLSGKLDRTVVDRTGLSGAFDFRYENPSDDRESNDIGTVFGSLERVGLKLVPGKIPVEMLVIDHVERPSAN